MAGIGWKLQKMIDRGSLAGTMGAYLTGVAVTSAPWLLTTVVLMTLRLAARGDGSRDLVVVDRLVTLVYALTVVLSAPVHVVVSRYVADRLYDKRLDRIAAPLWRALALTLVGFMVVGVALALALRPPVPVAIAGVLLTVVVGGQWLLLSVGGGMASPLAVLRAFAAGAPIGIVAAFLLCRGVGLGATGYVCGFTAGQLTTTVLLLHGIVRAIPSEHDEAPALARAFSEYWLLGLSSLVYYLSIWTDKLLVWLLAGSAAASRYSSVAAIAWFSVVPAFGWIYVQIETGFYQRFRSFYQGLGGGAALAALRQRAAQVTEEGRRILRGAVMVQGAVLMVALLGAPTFMRAALLPASDAGLFRLAVTGASLQLINLLEILLLYYFDLRREALIVSLALFLGEVALVTAAHVAGLPPAAGYALACALAAAVGLGYVRVRLASLLDDTFQSQPFGDAV